MLKQAALFIIFLHALSIRLVGQMQEAVPQLSGSGIIIKEDAASNHLHLYKGIEYVNYEDQAAGYPFFESEVLEKGSLVYDGILYEQVPMLYDIVKDEVVIEHFHNYFKIRLIPEKIAAFSLLNHSFIRIEADSLPGSGISSGFYEKLFDGKVKAFAKRIKITEEEIAYQQLKRRFVQKDRYYIFKEAHYVQVKGQPGVMRVFKDRKKEIKKYIRENTFTFKNNPEAAIISICRFYDTLQ